MLKTLLQTENRDLTTINEDGHVMRRVVLLIAFIGLTILLAYVADIMFFTAYNLNGLVYTALSTGNITVPPTAYQTANNLALAAQAQMKIVFVLLVGGLVFILLVVLMLAIRSIPQKTGYGWY